MFGVAVEVAVKVALVTVLCCGLLQVRCVPFNDVCCDSPKIESDVQRDVAVIGKATLCQARLII